VSGLGYQWRKNGIPIAGATAASYRLEPLGHGSAGAYDVLVSSEVQTVASAAAVLKMDPAIEKFVVQGYEVGADGQKVWVNPGETLWMQVQASSAKTPAGGLRYAWERMTSAGTYEPVSGPGVEGVESALLHVPATISGGRGAEGVYRVKVAGMLGSGTSASVEVGVRQPATVQGIEVTSSGQPVREPVVEGTDVLLRARGTGSEPARYTWYRNGQALGGAESSAATLHLPAAMAADAGFYQVEMANEAGSSLSEPVRLEVAAKPVLRMAAHVEAVAGQSFQIWVDVAAVGPIQYRWQRLVLGNWVDLAGSAGAVYSVAAAVSTDAGSYRVCVTSRGTEDFAQTEVRVVESSTGTSDAGDESDPSGNSTTHVNTASARWWIYTVSADGDTIGGFLPQYWVYDRLLQRSAWVNGAGISEEAGLRVDRWTEQDQYVEADEGFEVFALRVSERDWAIWDGFELTAVSQTSGVPTRLRGTYGVFGDNSRRPVILNWSFEQSRSLEGYADWEALLKSLADQTPGD
jgi:hypothetical protein